MESDSSSKVYARLHTVKSYITLTKPLDATVSLAAPLPPLFS